MVKVIFNVLLFNTFLFIEVFNSVSFFPIDAINNTPKSILTAKTNDAKTKNSIEVKWLPGMVQIKQNLFFDKGEITNFNWVEYLSWLEKIYGKNSEKYKNALPNPEVWADLGEQYAALDSIYLYSPEYRSYPVVGVSYQQAIEFSKWRSDRVLQLYLIKKRIIDYYNVKDKDSIFTIEKYFKGDYLDYNPSDKVHYYPDFSLPDSASYYKFSHFSDSLNALNYKSCKKRDLSNNLLIVSNCFHNSDNQQNSLEYGLMPIKSNDISSCRKVIIAHLKGNVREMTNTKGVFYGLSYVDSCDENYNKCSVDTNLVNSYTGFRNICRYKEWRK